MDEFHGNRNSQFIPEQTQDKSGGQSTLFAKFPLSIVPFMQYTA